MAGPGARLTGFTRLFTSEIDRKYVVPKCGKPSRGTCQYSVALSFSSPAPPTKKRNSSVRFLVVPADHFPKFPFEASLLATSRSARWFVLRLFCFDAQARYLHRRPIAESPTWTAVADTPATMKPNLDFNHQVS